MQTDGILAYPQCLAFCPDGKTRTITHRQIGETMNIDSPVKRLAKVYKGPDLWALFFGLMRTEFVKKMLPVPRVHSNDSAFVALLALEGKFAHIPEVLFKFRDKEKSTKRYESEGWLGKQEIKKNRKYQSFWPTASYICKKIYKTKLSQKEKLQAALQTIRWCISEQDTIKPETRKKIKKIVKKLK